MLKRSSPAALAAALGSLLTFQGDAQAQADRPVIETTKVPGTDNVYIFRNGNHQAMFIVTKAGVIATDPVAYGKPTGGQSYVDEIKKVTDKPIKYLIYSHHHYDHIAGGKAFKDAGATSSRTRARQGAPAAAEGSPHRAAGRDGRRQGPHPQARRHDARAELRRPQPFRQTLVMRLPKEKIIFVVDLIPVGQLPGPRHDRLLSARGGSLRSRRSSRWTGNASSLATPAPAVGSAASRMPRTSSRSCRMRRERCKKAAREGKCWDTVEKEIKLPKYEAWGGYENNLPFVLRRYCGLWGRGT